MPLGAFGFDANSVKAKAAITWVGAADGVTAEVRRYDRLFSDPNPGAGGKDFIEALNPNNLKVVTAYVEPSLVAAKPDQKYQFERFGYVVADRVDHVAGLKPAFKRVTGLKDSWGKWAYSQPALESGHICVPAFFKSLGTLPKCSALESPRINNDLRKNALPPV